MYEVAYQQGLYGFSSPSTKVLHAVCYSTAAEVLLLEMIFVESFPWSERHRATNPLLARQLLV